MTLTTDRLALGVKMNILLFMPGLLVLLFQYQGIAHGAICGALILAVQASPALAASTAPFFRTDLRAMFADLPSGSVLDIPNPR